MVILVIVCVIIIAILLFLYISLWKDIKNLQKQLVYTVKEESSFMLYTTSNNSQVKNLVMEINTLRNTYQLQKNRYMEMDANFKEMITNISHDIRTPLTSIKGYLELLETCDKQDFTRYYEIIHHRVLYLQDLLENLFLYTKITNEVFEYHMEVLHLYEELCDNILPFYQQFEEANIKVNIIASDERVQVLVDQMCVKRIFSNLFSNIAKYALSYVKIEMEAREQKVTLRFYNDMQGDVDINELFERFYTADHVRSFTNTGLGLAIVKELVERFSGIVEGEVRNHVMCISITFPMYVE